MVCSSLHWEDYKTLNYDFIPIMLKEYDQSNYTKSQPYGRSGQHGVRSFMILGTCTPSNIVLVLK